MQRYSGGLKVPRTQIESFIGKTTNAEGQITVALRYTPKSLGHIAADLPYVAVNKNHECRVESLSGRDVTVRFYEHKYYRAMAITTENSGGAGADPHGHSITDSETDVHSDVLDAVLIAAFGIVYEI